MGESDSVKLLTVHAAKGLQWPAVFVPGLSVGERSQVFPARPRVSTRWTENARLIPFGLRGDAGDLPELLGLDASSLDAFGEACAARDLAEERRLMYVAATRAAFWLGCSGYWWGEGGTSPLGPSPFLDEVRRSGVAQVSAWAPAPEPDAENPLLATVEAANWPATPAGRRYEAVREAAALVEAVLAGGTTSQTPPLSLPGGPIPPNSPWERPTPQAPLAATGIWWRPGTGTPGCCWPSGRSAGATARARWRCPPGSRCRRWCRWPGTRPSSPGRSAGPCRGRRRDRPAGARPSTSGWSSATASNCSSTTTPCSGRRTTIPPRAGDLAALRSRFERSEWADRWPQAVEVPFETLVGDRLVRGRIDAVFADAPGGGYDVVDWKTGQPPRSEAERHAVSVQLAAYRLAWAALAGVPAAAVRAAFYYVAHDQTARPADLLDEAGLAALIEQIPAET